MSFAQSGFAAAFRKRWADDTEFGQATARFLVSLPVIIYFFYAVDAGWIDTGLWFNGVIVWTVIYTITVITIFILISLHPGNYRLRRVFAAVADFTSCGVVLGAGGEATLPLFGALLWVTVGYGIRYGGRYLLLSTCLAQVTIAIVILINPYWQAHPFQSAAFVITLIIGPGYAFALIARLQLAHLAAQQANQRKSRFVAQVSHDLRQPIHAIRLIAAQLSDSNLTERQTRLVARIDQTTTGAIRQLQTFLNVTTIEAGMLQPHLAPVDLGKLIAEQAEHYATLAQSSGNAVRAVPSSLVVLTDGVFITTIIQNLLSNAINHAPACDVLIGCRRTKDGIAICIYDRGPGIPEPDLTRLTERYFRGSSAKLGMTPGLGLGLSIVKQMAESLGLIMAVKSQPNQGTAVWICGLTEVKPSKVGPVLAYQTYGNPLVGLRVAVIEDDPEALAATCELVERWGCIANSFTSPPKTIVPCDVFVSDFDFGGGRTLIDYPLLFQTGQPIIVITGHPRLEVAASMAGRSKAILEKPVHAAELRSALLAAQLALGKGERSGSP